MKPSCMYSHLIIFHSHTRFDVPENLKFGSFDSLIKLVDDMGKYDSQVESVIRRIERQVFDLDNKAELSVRFIHTTNS